MIELRNVSKIYGQSTIALRNLNLEIRDQEFFVIYGPAGAGKSTTLRIDCRHHSAHPRRCLAGWRIHPKGGSRKPQHGNGV